MITQFEETIEYIDMELRKWMTDDLLPRAVDDLPVLDCGCCGETLHIGDSIQYDKNYEVYCHSLDCVENIATQGTCLEHCWWGEDKDFWSMWYEVVKESKEKK